MLGRFRQGVDMLVPSLELARGCPHGLGVLVHSVQRVHLCWHWHPRRGCACPCPMKGLIESGPKLFADKGWLV